MTTIMPEGEEIQKAIKWISHNLEDNPNQPLIPLVEKPFSNSTCLPRIQSFS